LFFRAQKVWSSLDKLKDRATVVTWTILTIIFNFSGPASFNPLEAYGGMIQLSDLIRNILI